MSNWRHRLLYPILALVLILTGCSNSKASPPKGNIQTSKRQKPMLEVPKQFDSEIAKIQFAANAVMNGYYEEAKPLLEQALATHPDAMGYLRLGTARYNVTDLEGAIGAWRKAAELDKSLAGVVENNSGNALRDLRRHAEAEAAYRRALEIEPTRWTAAVNLATMLKENGKLAEAIAVLENSLPANPDALPLVSLLHSLKGNS